MSGRATNRPRAQAAKEEVKPGAKRAAAREGRAKAQPHKPQGQIVLVMQGGGALGAYQVGVYQAMHEAGLEPDWVIGTSIGAINAGLIAGSHRDVRMQRIDQFWSNVEQQWPSHLMAGPIAAMNLGPNAATLLGGIRGFFRPNVLAWGGPHAALGADRASYYCTEPLRETLRSLIDFDLIGEQGMRLTVGAVNALRGTMRYFDSREQRLGVEHVMASGALPPAFPAVRIDGEPYWDGGIYSNTPIEAVLDDRPRRDSLIFAVNVWQHDGPEPESIWEVMGRQKDIQYASRADSHLLRQKQIHHLRHVIRELGEHLPPALREAKNVREMLSWGCGTTMHVVHLAAPRRSGEDHTKDIDFTPAGIAARREAGYRDTLRMIRNAPWEAPVDPMEAVIEHRCEVTAVAS